MDARAAASGISTLRAHRLLGDLAVARGDTEAAARHFQAALDLAERCRFPFEGALTRLTQGRALAGAPAARADLERACAYFAEVRAEPPWPRPAGLWLRPAGSRRWTSWIRQRGPTA